jgi:hypothetical protein
MLFANLPGSQVGAASKKLLQLLLFHRGFEVDVSRLTCQGTGVQVEVSKFLKSRCNHMLVSISKCPSDGVSWIS